MRLIQVEADQPIGTIRSFQGVNDGPAPLRPGLADATSGYGQLRLDLVRTHDLFGPTDIDAQWPDPDPISKSVQADGAHSIFPNWNADPEQPSSYNFGPSDRVIQAIVHAGAEVYFRIGRSWGADPSPPPDFGKYANIVRHVVMHFNGGWAAGFHDRIRYWEIWNEPNLRRAVNPSFVREFWSGTPQQFYALFETMARVLKAHDPTLKVGGPGLAFGGAPSPCREGLLDYCARRRMPLDFFSWHHYAHRTGDPYSYVRIARQLRALLDAKGFPKAESHLSEWGVGAVPEPILQTTMETAAFVAAAAVYMQDAPIDRALYYRGDSGVMGLFDRNGNYRRKAYCLRAVGPLQPPIL